MALTRTQILDLMAEKKEMEMAINRRAMQLDEAVSDLQGQIETLKQVYRNDVLSWEDRIKSIDAALSGL
jgi:hypothetical protein